jgi:hypothetical protein
MTAMSMASRSGLAAARDLRQVMQGTVVLPGEDAYRAVLQGKVVLPGEDTYNRARQIWNGAVNHYPSLFALCETTEDVQAAVRAARAYGLPLSVRGGGHDWAGRALRHGGMVLDLSRMRRVEVDAASRVATVAGGATAADLVTATAPRGLVAVTGTVGAVGMAGLTLGGGYGPLSGRYGLALDNLLGAEMVLADGNLVRTSASENADLFWAVRGGGGNFGVVTSMRVRLHDGGTVLSGLIAFPWSEAKSVLQGYATLAASAPDELSIMAGIFSGPDDRPLLLLTPTWSGDLSEGRQVVAELERLGTPVLSRVGPMTFVDMLGMFDAHAMTGRHYSVRTRWLADLTPDVIATLVAAGSTRTSPISVIALHHFHGAATRVPLDATAFGLRREHFLVEIVAAWEPDIGGNSVLHRQWARNLSDALAPSALPGGYPNMLGPDDHDQIAMAFGSNVARLQYLKRRFDPDGVFTSAISLPARRPRGTAGMASR